MPTTSLGKTIAIAVGAPVVLAALSGLYLSYHRADEVLQRSAAEEASALADLIATSFSLAPPGPAAEGDPHAAVSAAMKANWQALKYVRDLRVLGRDGAMRWSLRAEDLGQVLPDHQRLLGAPPAGELRAGEYARPLGGMECARCHSGDAFRVGAVQLILSQASVAPELSSLYHGAFWFTLFLGLALFAAAALALRLFVTSRLRKLARVMGDAEGGHFLARAEVDRQDEIGDLARAFNSMLAKITDLKVNEIETRADLERMQSELLLKAQVETQHQIIHSTNRKLEERIRELTLLFDITRSLNSTLELGELLDLLAEMVGVTLGFGEFSIMLYDDERAELMIRTSYGLPPDANLEGMRLRLGQGAAGVAAQDRTIVYVADSRSDPRYVSFPGRHDAQGSLLCVPMICKESLVGVFNFVRPEPNAFADEEEIKLLQSVASQAAMAIVNARLYQKTLELSLTDALTGAFNRRHFFARLEMELARAQRFGQTLSVLMIDIDHFKSFNDNYGHRAGDVVLKEVANLITGAVRKLDTVARYGGEEFVILLPQIKKAESGEVAEKLRRAISRTKFRYGERQPGKKVTISLGYASYPEDGQSIDKLVDSADAALYGSKRAGRNRSTAYEPGMELHPGRERGPMAAKRKKPEKSAEAEDREAPPEAVAGKK